MVFIRCEEQVTAAAAITGTKARDTVQLQSQALSNSAFGSLLSGAEDYTANISPGSQVIYMPVALFCRLKMAVYPGFEAAHGRPDVGVVTLGEMQVAQSANGD